MYYASKYMKRRLGPLHYFALLAGLYIVLSLVVPANHVTVSRYHLSGGEYHILLLLVILPYAAIWLAAFRGYEQMQAYVQSIRQTRVYLPFRYVADGAKWLAWGLPVPALVSLLLNGIANSHPGFTGAAAVINSYLTLLFPLVAFSLLSTGSRQLITMQGRQVSSRTTKTMVLAFVILGTLFVYFVFRNLHSLAAGATNNPYHLPVWLVVITLIVPYLFTWFIGLLAAYEIWSVSVHTSGLLYRRGLQGLSRGLMMVVAASITLQYIDSLVPGNRSLSLHYLLVLIYLILLIYAVGFILIARSSSKLRRIEEV